MFDCTMNEDAYWERRREKYENPKRLRDEWEEPEYETDCWFPDDTIEEIEAEYKCPIAELYEGDLMELVERYKNVVPVSAEWDGRYECITYRRAG